MRMRAARMYGYKEALQLEEVPVPDIGSDEVLIKVAAAGMCRSDFQLVDGYFREIFRCRSLSHQGTRWRARSPRWVPMCRDRPACRRAS